jgi:hypothetical protein
MESYRVVGSGRDLSTTLIDTDSTAAGKKTKQKINDPERRLRAAEACLNLEINPRKP